MLEAIATYINDRYGSRRGLVNYWRFDLQHRLGGFARYGEVNWSRVRNLVFVCHGNICRSPLAEAVARQQHGLNAESFGLECTDGAKADPRAVEFADKHGINLASHTARHIRAYNPKAEDLVVVMEPKHILHLPTNLTVAQTTLIGLWLDRPHPYIHDPFSSGGRHFEYCESMVVRGVQGIAEQWPQSRK